MRTTNHYSSTLSKTLVFALTLASIFSSCKKDDKDLPIPTKPNLAIVHAAPGIPELTFYVDDVKTNTKALTYNTLLDYAPIKTGKRAFSITKKDATEVIVKSTFDLASNKSYSVFIADKTANALVLVEDDLSAPAADKAKVRFINLSPDAGLLDLNITGKTEALFSKKAFKEATAFVNTDPGAEISFEIRENGKTDVLATLPKIKVEKGKVYTIWAKGLKTGPKDETQLGIGIMTNK